MLSKGYDHRGRGKGPTGLRVSLPSVGWCPYRLFLSRSSQGSEDPSADPGTLLTRFGPEEEVGPDQPSLPNWLREVSTTPVKDD